MGKPRKGGFLFMTIYIYSDESGTFDYIHNEFFVFGGLICFDRRNKVDITRKYSHAEKSLRINKEKGDKELKASNISNASKGKLYRCLNGVYKFCVVIKQKDVNKKVYDNKKHKQRYLDYAYKIVLKKCMELLIKSEKIIPYDVRIIFVNADEHSTATDGVYELRENLLNEFKNGTFNLTWDVHYKPIFPRLKIVDVKFCNSSTTYLIRAADIIANHCYHKVLSNNGIIEEERNMFVYYLPSNLMGSGGLEYFDNYLP